MDTRDISKAQGHWILAKMGKKVLRPGGRELTQKMVSALDISSADDVVEFAPGLGFTAGMALRFRPKSYTGIDSDEDAITLLNKKIKQSNTRFVLSNAGATPIASESKDKVYGEAMLTMQADHRKAEIIREAHRILKNGGVYAIHELGLINTDDTLKNEIQRDLALTIKVNARPLTEQEWKNLLEREGFKVKDVITNEVHLLESKRIVEDEGFLRALKIGFNILLNPTARKRIMQMRKTFRKHQQHINAIALIAEKV